jgi:hypothetical protein
MDIQVMHTTFRALGQQVGMQLIRSILPEMIDTFINEAINEKVRSVIINNTMMQFNDRVAIQDNSISPINSIRTLYKRASLSVVAIANGVDFYTSVMAINKVMFYTSFGVRYTNIKRRVGARFIEGDKLDDTRADHLNRESWDYPIVTMLVDGTGKEYVELYTDSTTKLPNKLEVAYIELPAIVKWNAVLANGVSCNLPEYIHNEIVELAVSKFFKSVGSTTKPVTR